MFEHCKNCAGSWVHTFVGNLLVALFRGNVKSWASVTHEIRADCTANIYMLYTEQPGLYNVKHNRPKFRMKQETFASLVHICENV